MPNKCISFCFQLDRMSRIGAKEFLELNWLNVHDRYVPFIVSDIFNFYSNQCPDSFNDIYYPVDDDWVATRSCIKNLKLPFRKSKFGINSLSYVGPSSWSKLSNNLRIAIIVNCFKKDIEKYFLKKLSKTEADI